jgi:proteasome maturation protein
MEEYGLQVLKGPADHLRSGFNSLERAHMAPHPVQILQTKSEMEWTLKLDTVRRTYGSHMAMRLATEKSLLNRQRRLPGLESSNIARETLLGTDEKIDFSDFLNGKFFSTLFILML